MSKFDDVILFAFCGILWLALFNSFTTYHVTQDVVLALKRCNESSPFSIHGLWYEKGDFCSNVTFDLSVLETLQPRMEKNWYTCYPETTNNTEFWKHEWTKHGTCFNMSEYAYFLNTLDKFDKVDLHLCNYTKMECIVNVTMLYTRKW